jgi:hypothetical protein
VQVDPITPKLKAPGSRRLNLKHEKLLSDFAFKFSLRRYTTAGDCAQARAVKEAEREVQAVPCVRLLRVRQRRGQARRPIA